MSETTRVWDLLQRAYAGDVWHGPSLRNLLEETSAEQAAAHPVPGARSIFEITRHVATYLESVRRRLAGEHVPELPRAEAWPVVEDTSPQAWRRAVAAVEDAHGALRRAVAEFPEEDMGRTVTGRDYPHYLMLHGIVQHYLYHAGQITVLLQAQGHEPVG